jgi:hypothetical protein
MSLAGHAGFENLVLTGTVSLSGGGNTAANAVTGNDGANSVSGDVWADTLTGGAGGAERSGEDVVAGALAPCSHRGARA